MGKTPPKLINTEPGGWCKNKRSDSAIGDCHSSLLGTLAFESTISIEVSAPLARTLWPLLDRLTVRSLFAGMEQGTEDAISRQFLRVCVIGSYPPARHSSRRDTRLAGALGGLTPDVGTVGLGGARWYSTRCAGWARLVDTGPVVGTDAVALWVTAVSCAECRVRGSVTVTWSRSYLSADQVAVIWDNVRGIICQQVQNSHRHRYTHMRYIVSTTLFPFNISAITSI